MARLTDAELRSFLDGSEGWSHVGEAIHKRFSFTGFRGSIAFVNRVADLANEARHHPDLEVHYDLVLVSLSTHDEGGVTAKDVALASQIDAAAEPAEG